MKYKNKKTGQVITTTGKVSGGDWELVKEKTLDPVTTASGKPKGKGK